MPMLVAARRNDSGDDSPTRKTRNVEKGRGTDPEMNERYRKRLRR